MRISLLLLMILGLTAGCSAPKIASVEESFVDNEKEVIDLKSSTKEKVQKTQSFGPSKARATGAFVDVTSSLGLANAKSVHNYIVDWTGDGVDDLVVLPEYYGTPIFYRYDRKEKKYSKAKYNPFGKLMRTSFMAFVDLNRDNLLDVILVTLNQKTELNKDPLRLFIAHKDAKKIHYKLKPDAFPKKVLPVSSLGLIDYNMDGKLDLYIGTWFDFEKNGNKSSPDRLYEATEDGLTFVDVSSVLEGEHKYDKSLKAYTHATPTYGVQVCDVDQNGYPDIASASSSGYSNRLWLNLKKQNSSQRSFKDFGEKTKFSHDSEGAYSPLGGGNSFYALCHDYNNDGSIDFAVGELFHSYDTESRDRSSILTGIQNSSPPEFLRTEYHMDDGTGSWNQGDRRAIWLDYNFDSFTDLIVENSGFPLKSRLIVFDQDRNHSFADLAKNIGVDVVNPSGIAAGDFNNDGRADLFVGQVSIRNASIEPRLFIFENKFKWNGKKVLKIRLRGQRSNYHGLGATVIMTTNMGIYRKVVSYLDGGLPSQNQEGLFFGLQNKEVVTNIEVRWPYLKTDRSGKKYPYRRNYHISNKFKKFKEITLKDFP